MVLYQDTLIDRINRTYIDALPKSLILLGEFGSGKHLISEYISSKFNLTSIDITNDLTYDTLEDITFRVEPYLYIINASDISIKEQNIILKFLEEPLKNSFIIILCENKNQLLPTVLNRCQIWELKQYTDAQLKEFITFNNPEDIELILKVARTPGQIKDIDQSQLHDMFDLTNKIIDKIGNASLPNTLSISDKLAFKNEKDKFNILVFVKLLNYCFLNKIQSTDTYNLFSMYSLTNKLLNDLYVANVNKKYLFENYLLNLRNMVRGDN